MIFGRDEIKGGLKKTLNDNCRKVIEEQQLGFHLRLKYLHLYVYLGIVYLGIYNLQFIRLHLGIHI